MLIRLVVASILLLIGLIAYFLAKREYQKEQLSVQNENLKKQANWQKALDAMNDSINTIVSNGLPLLGTSMDTNSDFEVSKAIKMIKLPDDVRIQIYD